MNPDSPASLPTDLHAPADPRIALVSGHELLLLEHLKLIADSIPIGLLVLDLELQPIWFNAEAARACAVWNYGERMGIAMRERRVFEVPPPITAAAAHLRTRWNEGALPGPALISEEAQALYAQVLLHVPRASERAAFHVQIDYRRPRGDRDRAVSPNTLALLARLTAREREVAIRVRDGLSNVEIARELYRSPLTIKTQLRAIYQKLGVGCRTRVAAMLNR
jgi:DNA-binding CsgD family transcriptional regulator